MPFDEIEKNEFNLNIPRYIDSQEDEDIKGHWRGRIPEADIDALERYWTVRPGLRGALFTELRPGYATLAVDKTALKSTIYGHSEFADFIAHMEALFAD